MDRKELIWQQFVELTAAGDNDIDLGQAALLIAATEYPQLDIDRELAALDSLSAGASRRLGEGRDPLFCLNTLSEYLFDEVGFTGNTEDYYDPRNSYLNEVLSRRLGIPITLSLVSLEVGKRIGIPLVGVGMPGHFLLRHRDEPELFIDSFHRGILLSEEECATRMREITGRDIAWDSSFLTPVTNREYVARLLRNLKGIYFQRNDLARALTMIDRLVVLQPDEPSEVRDRGIVRYRMGRYKEALDDIQFFLEYAPPGSETESLERMCRDIRDRLGDD